MKISKERTDFGEMLGASSSKAAAKKGGSPTKKPAASESDTDDGMDFGKTAEKMDVDVKKEKTPVKRKASTYTEKNGDKAKKNRKEVSIQGNSMCIFDSLTYPVFANSNKNVYPPGNN